MQVIFTPRAEGQLDRLLRRADGYIARIVEFCTGLATFPLRGQVRNDLLEGLRTIGFERRVTIAFIVTADAVLTEGVFYGGQDFEALFLGDSRAGAVARLIAMDGNFAGDALTISRRRDISPARHLSQIELGHEILRGARGHFELPGN